MKNTGICPKCSGNELIKIQEPSNAASNTTKFNIRISTFEFAEVTRYLCKNCGFLEEWVEDTKKIEKLSKKYR